MAAWSAADSMWRTVSLRFEVVKPFCSSSFQIALLKSFPHALRINFSARDEFRCAVRRKAASDPQSATQTFAPRDDRSAVMCNGYANDIKVCHVLHNEQQAL